MGCYRYSNLCRALTQSSRLSKAGAEHYKIIFLLQSGFPSKLADFPDLTSADCLINEKLSPREFFSWSYARQSGELREEFEWLDACPWRSQMIKEHVCSAPRKTHPQVFHQS
eukprot:Blabericola_migrator_1__1879@NODE_1510_length_4388_cov_32_092803_g992_i0_p3_GENE_NODE_1510_length_4388_cov_32_092803_g992_i0NODE_1510_length_4388_cov_32_092803_g992_i0_p3_ORF_typecomplete_len112_score10_67_NODE_1510_length_4388_cov_32_092803_g992_i0481816